MPATLEPIAIVGIGCRFPGGASSPHKLWELLCQGFDGIIEVPADRWDSRRFYHPDPTVPGKMIVRKGGFIQERLDCFDAAFFQITPREADSVDPQQRLLLEVTWEAMEDGGIVPSVWRGSQTGIFVGGFTTDWQNLNNRPSNIVLGDAYTGINSSQTILSARLAYFFDFKGPCLTVDTACSSSLVAIHLACQNLWNRTCVMALAGGVNAMLVPEPMIAMSKGRFLNPEGYCRSFDADAKGYVRGEGAGMVILKPLSLALRDRDPIYALIRGTGINHDGHTNGLALPNPEAQKTLIASVLQQAQVLPSDIQYIEAHGTGTLAGDPMEAWALDQVLRNESTPRPKCLIGSIKSNIGHLEAAAGIAGLIKTALCLKHRTIPPNRHFNRPNPAIPFDQYGIEVSVATQPFPEPHKTLYAGVNSFGYGGTNAHAILQEHPGMLSHVQARGTLVRPFPFPLSAKSKDALQDQVRQLADFLQDQPDVDITDIAYTLCRRREHLPHRVCVVAQTAQDLYKKLLDFHSHGEGLAALRGEPLEKPPKIAFVYTGMGPQWWGMGRELLDSEPVFRETMEACDRPLTALAGWSLLDELAKDEHHSNMDQPEYAQLANFALQAALTELLKSWGVVPEGVVGHSIGEVAAAYASGAITLEEGVRISYHRSRLQARRKGQGTMLAAEISREQALTFVERYPLQLSIAAINGPTSLTLAGEEHALREVAGILEGRGTFNRLMKVNIAYHSYQMEGLQEEVLQAMQGLAPKTPDIPLFSTVAGQECCDGRLDGFYWWQNIRQPVLFEKALQEMSQRGYNLFVEVGPHPILSKAIKDTLSHVNCPGVALYTLNRKEVEAEALARLIARLHMAGVSIDWERLLPSSGQLLQLPNYPWQRKHHWKESEESKHYRLGHAGHPFLAQRCHTPEEAWSVEVNSGFFPWLEDHQIDGSIVFPAAAYVEAGIALHKQRSGEETCILEDVNFRQALVLTPGQEPVLRISCVSHSRHFQIHSWNKEWTLHATGTWQSPWKGYTPAVLPIKEILQRCPQAVASEAIYARFARHGLKYGPAFRLVQRLYQGKGEALAEILVPTYPDPYHLPPPVLDAALHTLVGMIKGDSIQEGIILPVQMDEVHFFKTPQGYVWCYAKETHRLGDLLKGDLILCDHSGTVCVELRGVTCRLFKNAKFDLKSLLERWVYRFEWQAIGALPETMPAGPRQIFTTENTENTEEKLAAELLQKVNALDDTQQHTVWIVTQGVHAVISKEQALPFLGSSLWGLARVIRQEKPHCRCRLIDWDPAQELCSEAILASIVAQTEEDEIAVRDGKLFVRQLFQGVKESETIKEDSEVFALELSKPGAIENLCYRSCERTSPRKWEIEIRVHTAALNFKDLMKVLALLDESVLEGTYFGNSFGMECSGMVVAVGPGVSSFKVGDQVCAFARNTFRSYLTCSAQAVCPIPPGAAMEEAPLYIPFITVLRGLKDIARLKKGETILIHTATGAVGLAAVQYAQQVGAHIIATAGSPEKRAYLQAMGIEHVADSRSLQFSRQVREWTQGQGVDVILNALSGEALIKSWELLAPYGRFIEIGKRDISQNTGLPMEVFQRNTTFAAIDLDRTFVDDKRVIQRLLREAIQGFKKGYFKPMPCEVYPPSQIHEAFHKLARAKHIGKIMIRFEQACVNALPAVQCNTLFQDGSTYLITGGLRGFGLATAQWIADNGGRHLILLSRQGPVDCDTETAIKALESKGVKVSAATVDVSDRAKLKVALNKSLKGMPPLKGVFHAAMVLDDDWISKLNANRLHTVMQPKVAGCWNLHALTQGMPLDYFVLYSSISSLIGNPGQGSYAAANAFLDAFAQHRHKLGLPALTVNWGAIADVGVVARQASLASHLQQSGIQPMQPQLALRLLGALLQTPAAQYGIIDVDWSKLLAALPSLQQTALFGGMKVTAIESADSDFQRHLMSLDSESQLKALMQMIGEKVAFTLKIDVSRIEVKKKLNALGIDSLMAMELQHLMEQTLKFKIPTMELMKGPSIEELARSIQRQVGREST